MDNKTIEAVLADPVNGRLALSASLGNFIKFFHWYLYHQEFVMKDFHLLVIRKIEDIAFGRASKRNLAITIAPRLGKSSICKYACAWSYMLNPASNCIYTSYSDDLASDFSKEIREIVESEAFRRLTGLGFKKGKTGADYWVTTGGGGFRAAPLAGGLTGYGCFSYGTRVITDEGNLRIGDIVREKKKVRFKSVGENGIEWKYPQGYIENKESDFLRIILNDGTIIDCTTDHKFYTKDGIKRADELTLDSVFPSDTENCIFGYMKFIRNIFMRVVFIADKLSLFFRGKVFVNRGLFDFNDDSLGFTSPVDSGLNISYISKIKAVIRRYFLIASRILSNLSRYIGINFAISVMRTVANRILFIFGLRSISKIFRGIIKRIAVKVSNNLSFRSFAKKSKSDKAVNGNVFITKTYKKIPFIRFPWFKNFRLFPSKTSNSSERGDFIFSFPFRDRKPLFIYHIGKFPSYCVNIPVNHNLFLAGRQQVLARNCGVSGEEFGGFGIIDDPQKPSLVKSQTELQNTIDLYENAFKSRANNRAKTPFLMIMQRVAVDDLTGYVLENESEDWDLVKVPALDEETGKSVWEEKLPAAELLKLKKQNPFVYYSQYQQEPIVIGGSVIKTEWFRYYNTADTFTYQCSWFTADTAQKKGEANDFTVFQYWAKTYDNRLHLIDMVRGKFDAPELREQIIMFWEKWKKGINGCVPYGFYIEDKSSGIGAIQEIRKTYPLPIIPITRARYKDGNMIVKQDKFSRVMTIVPYIANGWVYLPNSEKDDMSSLLLAEAAAFRADLGHKHDDQIDCLADAVDIAFGATGISSIFI